MTRIIYLYYAYATFFIATCLVLFIAGFGLGHRRNKKNLAILVLLVSLCACTPKNNVPTYNITVTDNSQIVIGNDNQTKSTPTTETKTESVATVGNSKEIKNYMWIYWLIITFVVGIGGYIGFKKIKKF